MADPVTINLQPLARSLDIPLQQVETVVELLDEGNTVPFITRYRKDRTGGLDEEQIREIQSRLKSMRLLADRKETILRSIESQGKLTERLSRQILSATTTKRLEDLYLPFKPKKQTLATTARTRGLELLAREILSGTIGADQLDARAADFVNTDRQVPTAADALLGAGHILAEEFSEKADLRHRLRDILQRSGKVVCSPVSGDVKPAPEKTDNAASAEAGRLAAQAALAAEQPWQKPPPPRREWAGISPESPLVEAAVLQTDSMSLGAMNPNGMNLAPNVDADDSRRDDFTRRQDASSDGEVPHIAGGAGRRLACGARRRVACGVRRCARRRRVRGIRGIRRGDPPHRRGSARAVDDRADRRHCLAGRSDVRRRRRLSARPESRWLFPSRRRRRKSG